MMNVRIPTGRFAPTPSGYMHAGNILCALIAYLSVKSKGGRFLVRIEDLDAPRCPRSCSLEILNVLDALGLKSDAPTVFQSDRADAYKIAESALGERAKLYPCFCTRAELHAAHAPRLTDGGTVYSGACKDLTAQQAAELSATRKPCVRIEVPDRRIAFVDGLYGEYSQNLADECGDFIIKRSDGIYAYQLAVVADDGESGVTEVVRGADLLSSTPRQIFLQRLLDLPVPEYYHIPLVCDADGRKLSKSQNDSAERLLNEFDAETVLGGLACSAGIIPVLRPTSLDELTQKFDWKNVVRDRIVLPEKFSAAL